MREPMEHPVGCDCATCLGDGESSIFVPPPDTRNAGQPFFPEDEGDELDGLHCPNCGQENVWHGRDEKQRICGECRYAE